MLKTCDIDNELHPLLTQYLVDTNSYNFLQSFIRIASKFFIVHRREYTYLGVPVTQHGTRVEALTSFYGSQQLIKTPRHLFQISATCIDLVFANQPHLVMKIGVPSLLCRTCQHQIIFAKLNLKVKYPPAYILGLFQN